MGFPVGCTEVFLLPKLLLHFLSLLTLLRSATLSLFRLLGLPEFIEQPDGPIFQHQENQTRLPNCPPLSAVVLRELLSPSSVIKFEEAGAEADPTESCAVCLYEFSAADEIRWLPNCKHIFHRGCLDRWMDHDQTTCPLCRTHLVPRELQDEFNHRLWAAAAAGGCVANDDDYHEDITTTTTTTAEFSSLFGY